MTKRAPSLVSFSLPLSFGQAKESGIVSPPAQGKELDPILGLDEARSCWAVFVCILFSLAEDRENRIAVSTSVCTGRCRPPVWPAEIIRICQQRKKNTAGPMGLRCFSGAAGQIRTADLILTKDALYLLSYSSKAYAPHNERHMWRPRRDLNPRPPA